MKSNSAASSCGKYSYSEVEDYYVRIDGGGLSPVQYDLNVRTKNITATFLKGNDPKSCVIPIIFFTYYHTIYEYAQILSESYPSDGWGNNISIFYSKVTIWKETGISSYVKELRSSCPLT